MMETDKATEARNDLAELIALAEEAEKRKSAYRRRWDEELEKKMPGWMEWYADSTIYRGMMRQEEERRKRWPPCPRHRLHKFAMSNQSGVCVYCGLERSLIDIRSAPGETHSYCPDSYGNLYIEQE